MRTEATLTGCALVDVGSDPDWADVADSLGAALAPALRVAPRLQAGQQLAAQRALENAAATRQIRMWAADIDMAELPEFGYACECGRSGCDRVVAANPDEYDTFRIAGPVLAPEHGPDTA